MFEKKDENYIYYVVGQNIKKIRKSKKMTQRELANLCNYSEGFIMNIESKKYYQTFSLGTIWKISLALEVDIKCLFEDVD